MKKGLWIAMGLGASLAWGAPLGSSSPAAQEAPSRGGDYTPQVREAVERGLA